MQQNNTILPADTLKMYPVPDAGAVDGLWKDAVSTLGRKIVVLDDDPTGIQTVHGVSVYTNWQLESVLAGFREERPLFFILTNSRAMSCEETARIHAEIARNIAQAAALTGKDYLLVSRGDSTLRGHYPLETATLRDTIEACSSRRFDGEIIMPFFREGGRFTLNDIHYVREGDDLIPAAQTEFAGDKTFGFSQSHLGRWCQEKTQGAYQAEDMCYISLDSLRALDVEGIAARLIRVSGFQKVIVNAIDDCDAKVFVTACAKALHAGREFLFRSAASLVKALGGIADRPLLQTAELVAPDDPYGGLVVIGSHVNKTSQQLAYLQEHLPALHYIVFDQHRVLEKGGLAAETATVARLVDKCIQSGETAVVYTRRERIDLSTADGEAQLDLAVQISDAVTDVVAQLTCKPAFILAKGGITSSEIGTKALRVKRALVLGQIQPGIPVWLTDEDSRFPHMPYVIFPGNVGAVSTLSQAVSVLQQGRSC